MRRRSACNSSRSRGFASGGTRSYLFGCICLSLCLKIQNITLKKIVQLTYSPLAGIIIIIIIICFVRLYCVGWMVSDRHLLISFLQVDV